MRSVSCNTPLWKALSGLMARGPGTRVRHVRYGSSIEEGVEKYADGAENVTLSEYYPRHHPPSAATPIGVTSDLFIICIRTPCS